MNERQTSHRYHGRSSQCNASKTLCKGSNGVCGDQRRCEEHICELQELEPVLCFYCLHPRTLLPTPVLKKQQIENDQTCGGIYRPLKVTCPNPFVAKTTRVHAKPLLGGIDAEIVQGEAPREVHARALPCPGVPRPCPKMCRLRAAYEKQNQDCVSVA